MKKLLILLLLPIHFVQAQVSLDTKIAEASRQLTCPAFGVGNPISLNSILVDAKDSLAIVVKVQLAPGWHIYQYVPSTKPYIPMKLILKLPDGVRAIGPWIKPRPIASASDPGVLIYLNEMIFIQKIARSSLTKIGSTIQAGLYYQACNLHQCLPPREKTFDFKI
jgi:DsbC/DsbD-like thiol-disulfide interchange protein